MTFDFQRAKTPAYITSLALVVIGLLCASGSVAVLSWILTLLGLALNVVAVSITSLDGPGRARRTGTRVVEEPEADTEQHDVVAPSRAQREVSGRSGAARPEHDAARGGSAASGSSAVRATAPVSPERSAS
ncbi:hypothetical protein ACUW97_001264 [Kocuria rhizophila]|uniref:hypothetical protein n=1 Tax=Kocuria sp. BT304 TaxID=1702043 RepID=UPI000DD38E61|nr:hypothetical protein [Kocuria sp. BT304]